ETDVRRKRPVVAGTEDPHISAARRDPECIEQAMVVVGGAVPLVNRDVQLVTALDQVQAVDGKGHVGFVDESLGLHLFQFSVGAKAADTVGIEEADAKNKIAGW